MSVERTFAIVKPDAVRGKKMGAIVARIEEAGFTVLAAKLMHMTAAQAGGFYAVHRDRPFYASLCRFMTEGPSLVMVLEADNAIAKWRELMGATDPAKADAGTIRKEFGESIEQNAIHGSDSDENAAIEIAFFFSGCDLVS